MTMVVDAPPIEIVANSEDIVVASESVRVGRLPIRKLLALGRIVAPALAGVDAKDLRDMKNGADWQALLALLQDAVLGEAYALVTNKEADWCLDNFDIATTGQLIEALVRHNDLGPLKRVFTQAGVMPSQETSASTSSDPDSSQHSPAPELASATPSNTHWNG